MGCPICITIVTPGGLHRRYRLLYSELPASSSVTSVPEGQQAQDCPITQPMPQSRGRSRAMTYVIAQPCIGTKDASCVEVCPVDCIHSDDDAEQYYINPAECIDCGVCAEVCPVEAIYFEDDLPEQYEQFKLINLQYYE
jgi:NAD-dependent dihydropyrimidine dehydrogenase PreA subunit